MKRNHTIIVWEKRCDHQAVLWWWWKSLALHAGDLELCHLTANKIAQTEDFILRKTGECLYIELRPVIMPHQHFFHPKCHAKRCDMLNTRCKVFYEKGIFDFHPLCLAVSLKFHRSILVFPFIFFTLPMIMRPSLLPHSIKQ